MADINELKQILKSTIENVAGKTKVVADKAADAARDIAGKTADKTKAVARITKLNLEISSEKDTIKKAYSEIGRLYYELHHNDPDTFFIQLCDEVTLANNNIAEKESEITELKASLSASDDDGIDVEFEEVVDETGPEPVCDDKHQEPEAAQEPEIPEPVEPAE